MLPPTFVNRNAQLRIIKYIYSVKSVHFIPCSPGQRMEIGISLPTIPILFFLLLFLFVHRK